MFHIPHNLLIFPVLVLGESAVKCNTEQLKQRQYFLKYSREGSIRPHSGAQLQLAHSPMQLRRRAVGIKSSSMLHYVFFVVFFFVFFFSLYYRLNSI